MQKNYKEALRHYHKAILHLAGIISQNSSVSAYSKDVASAAVAGESDDMKYRIYLNMSQIYIFDDKIEKAL